MTDADKLLWAQIDAFEVDDPGAEFTFSMRLARENAWPLGYALQVIAEYKRFLFLACTAGHPVTPSDQIDQAWHLHLIYTHSYWKVLCKEVLKRELHHGPTQGGDEARDTYVDLYQMTLDSYQMAFQEKPPAEVWPEPDIRFRDIRFSRINRRKNWIIKKPFVK